ncbi:predicted protein [Botrytis cinerea T4]|uniref:Uncharacterized protein n=1 Tax=Botryotinia fuckeliana (strain T4) TaxID=999810 RepID=G2YX38_BOTF4|nr:predicted protein [Botrytis cinerea T4]
MHYEDVEDVHIDASNISYDVNVIAFGQGERFET